MEKANCVTKAFPKLDAANVIQDLHKFKKYNILSQALKTKLKYLITKYRHFKSKFHRNDRHFYKTPASIIHNV